MPAHRFILTLSCADRRGVVHAVSGHLLQLRANILEAAQFEDTTTGLFFLRMRFELEPSDATESAALASGFEPIAHEFGMAARFAVADAPMPIVIMVSQLGRCLNDLLFRWRSGLLPVDIRAVVSNHRDFYQLTAGYGIPFHHVPVTAATRAAAEDKLMEIFESENAELLVLARYMQILSDPLCRRLQGRAINIHHSFLPSFKGARPYQQAHDRGVKLIGATAHYVTAELDEGPIIEQDVARAGHGLDTAALTRIGGDIECSVLARAVLWHAERRILLNGHKTVVFQ